MFNPVQVIRIYRSGPAASILAILAVRIFVTYYSGRVAVSIRRLKNHRISRCIPQAVAPTRFRLIILIADGLIFQEILRLRDIIINGHVTAILVGLDVPVCVIRIGNGV